MLPLDFIKPSKTQASALCEVPVLNSLRVTELCNNPFHEALSHSVFLAAVAIASKVVHK